VSTLPNLTGLYARVAADMGGPQLRTCILTLRTEPEPRHPHITQALDAFTEEAAKRGLEINDA
jgi:hypothetical protein